MSENIFGAHPKLSVGFKKEVKNDPWDLKTGFSVLKLWYNYGYEITKKKFEKWIKINQF